MEILLTKFVLVFFRNGRHWWYTT